MFDKSKFSTRPSSTYPPFAYIGQAWYSPLLSKWEEDKEKYAACVTLGVTTGYKDRETGVVSKKEIIFLSAFQTQVQDVVTLHAYIKASRGDYLNHTTSFKSSNRHPHELIYPEMQYSLAFNQILFRNCYRLQFESYNIGSLEQLLNLALPNIYRIKYSKLPNTNKLRPEDEALINLLLAYPSPHSYAITLALASLVYYLQVSSLLNSSNTD